MIRNIPAFCAKISPLLSLSVQTLESKIKSGHRFTLLKNHMSAQDAEILRQSRIEGLGLSVVQQRVYPNGDMARSVLGLVGTEGHGLTGLELTLEKRLQGAPHRFALIRDGAGHSIFKHHSDAGITPNPVKLTIDRNIQFLAEEALREAAAMHSFKSGLIAIQNPNNGEILAMAAWPPTPLKNPLVQDAYEPGSTFKVVTALSALDEGLVRPDETFSGEHGKWEISPKVFITDHEPGGEMTLSQILEKSSNIGIAKVVDRVGPSRFYKMCRAFGFGAKTGVSLPGETAGELKSVPELTKVGLASSSYGYNLQVSALQILGAYSAIANGGILWEPRLLLDGTSPVKVRRIASESAVRRLTEMLESTVAHGTGVTAQIPGFRVAGKTGTARKIDSATHKYSTTAFTASFAGFLPVEHPRWTILVVLNEPKGAYYGGLTAAPVFSRIGKRLLVHDGIMPEGTSLAASSPARL
jgi:cell division protein FtsI (penicillin-binding protein 3)